MATTNPCIYVLAGTNGAGKSSVLGDAWTSAGLEFFNPDDVTRRLLQANPLMLEAEANAAAWNQGRRNLERAVAERGRWAFETTLGGNTIAELLERALDTGMEVRIWYCALATPELHIARVKARVGRGGHDIPDDKIRHRYDASRENLIHLLPKLTELRLYDNSADADPLKGRAPKPMLVLHLLRRKIVKQCPLRSTPDWAKPIVMTAMNQRRLGGS